MHSETLEKEEAECAEGRTAPRVKLEDIKAGIVGEYYITGDKFIDMATRGGEDFANMKTAMPLTICLLVMGNGFTIIGKSAPASPENFDAELGKKLAYEDAMRQVWPLMGFALRDRLYRNSVDAAQINRAHGD